MIGITTAAAFSQLNSWYSMFEVPSLARRATHLDIHASNSATATTASGGQIIGKNCWAISMNFGFAAVLSVAAGYQFRRSSP